MPEGEYKLIIDTAMYESQLWKCGTENRISFWDHSQIMLYNIYIYSFSRCFYPKQLTIEEYNKQFIIKRKTVKGSACNTNF